MQVAAQLFLPEYILDLSIATQQDVASLIPRLHPDFEKSGEGLGAKLCHDRKWWTRLVHNVDSVS